MISFVPMAKLFLLGHPQRAEMPIFQSYRLLFVHIPKNAGRSVEAALLGETGTPDGGRRSLLNRAATFLARETASRFPRDHLIGTLDVSLAAQHLTYVEMEMLGLLPDEAGFRSFATVRNPYDRALSSVMHFREGSWVQEMDERQRMRGFEEQLAQWLEQPIADHNQRAHRRSQVAYLRNQEGLQAVETILRFEMIDQDFKAFMRDLGISGVTLPIRGHGGRTRDYRDYFDPASRRRVELAFGEDIDAFEYSF